MSKNITLITRRQNNDVDILYNKPCVGFLTYDLQPFTEDCIYRIYSAIKPLSLRAYPVFNHPYHIKSRIPFFSSKIKGKYFGVSKFGKTPEGFVLNTNWRAAWECARQSNIIVLFGLQGTTALLTGFLGLLMGRRMISVNQTLPIQWEHKRIWWVRLLKKWLLHRCLYHVYQTPASKDVLINVYSISEKNMFYAPFEAGASLFKMNLEKYENDKANVRNYLNIGDEVIFLFVGNLHPFKGVSDIIKAAGRMPRDSSYICVFAGPEEPRNKIGGTIEYYMKLAKDMGVEKNLRFTGVLPHEKLSALYWASDTVILPTYRDMFPKVLVEGALASKPLITTSACGAAGAMVIDGDNGFIVEPGNIDSLVDAMSSLLDKGLREKMGQRSLDIVSGFCDKEAETRGFVSVIQKTYLEQI